MSETGVEKRHGSIQKDDPVETTIDIGDLPPEQARLIREFVEFLKTKIGHNVHPPGQAHMDEPVFARWPLGVKDRVSREDIYDHL